MRKIILFLVAMMVGFAAHAEPRVVTKAEWDKVPFDSKGLCLPNKANGMIVVTLQKKRSVVFSTNPAGNTQTGVWEPLGESHIAVYWQSGSKSTFAAENMFPCVF